MNSARVNLVLLVATSVMGCGCLSSRLTPDAQIQQGYAGSVGPFAPASLRIHPLTHLETDANGSVYLLLHIQFRDRWADLCKGIGHVQVYLYRPRASGGTGQETQELAWEVSLTNLDQNAVFFDPATQTYRFSLGGLPAWVETMASGDSPGAGVTQFRLIARMTTPTPDGGQTVLVDEYVVRP